MSGLFGGDDDEAPEINVTPYTPTQVAPEFKPINSMNWFDNISGEQFSFVRDREGNLTVNTRDISGKAPIDSPIGMNNINVANNIGVNNIGVNNIPTNNIAMNPVNVTLPNVGNLAAFNNRYAAAVAVLTAELRNLGNTISVIENTAPELIPQNRALIDAFRQANQRAMDKGFDIRRNGIDKKLREMGLSNSSTALGAEIAQARDRVDAEITSNLQVAGLADKTKQQTLATQFQLGQQIVQQATVEMNKYNSESQNELNARGQDLSREQLIQQRGSEQANLNLKQEQSRVAIQLASEQLRVGTLLNLEKARVGTASDLEKTRVASQLQLEQMKNNTALSQEQMRINTELAARQLRSGQMHSRNPTNAAVSMITNTNNQAIQAAGSDNSAFHNRNLAEIGLGQAEVQRFQANQAAQSNPMGQLLMTGGGALVGGLGGGLGSSLGGGMGVKMGGVDPFKKWFN